MGEGRKLTIYRQFFTQSDCYKADDTSKFRGVQVHSTGSNNPFLWRYVQPDDGRLGVNKNGNSHNRPGGDVCASAYIGKLKDGTVAVYQALPWDTRCWISGKGRCGNANKVGFIGFEICEDDLNSESYFHAAVMTAAVNLTAHLCQLMGVHPDDVLQLEIDGKEGDSRASVWKLQDLDVLAVMDHSELAARGLASSHADISHWLRRYGKRMSDFRAEVALAMSEGVEVEYIDAGEIEEEWTDVDKQMQVWSANGGYVNLRDQPDTESYSLERLDPGDVVRVTAMTGVWSKVETQDHAGYVMTQFLKDIPKSLPETVSIPREMAQKIYDALGAALKE